MKVTAKARPFHLTFRSSGNTVLLTSEDAQRILDSEVIVSASKFRVVLQATNTTGAVNRVTLRPATVGGGPAFEVTK